MGRGVKLSENECFTIKIMQRRGENLSQIANSLGRSRNVIRKFLNSPDSYGKSYKGKNTMI